MVFLFTLYTDFPSFSKAEQWLDTQINLFGPFHEDIVRWSSTFPYIYTTDDIGPVYLDSPRAIKDDDAYDSEGYRINLDTRYIMALGYDQEDSCRQKVILMKNGHLSYPSHASIEERCFEVPIIFSTEHASFRDRFNAVDSSDENGYAVPRRHWSRFGKYEEIDLSTCASYESCILDAQTRLREIVRGLTTNVIDWERLGYDPWSGNTILGGSRLRAMVIVTGQPGSGKSTVAVELTERFPKCRLLDVQSFFGEVATRAHCTSYAHFDATAKTALVVQQIEYFCRANPRVAGLVLDHIDDYEVMRRLKRIMHTLEIYAVEVRDHKIVKYMRVVGSAPTA